MSDTVLKLIPTDPRHIPPVETHQRALDMLIKLTQGWDPGATVFDRLRYIDPGEYIDAVVCPRCQSRLRMDWSPEHTKYFEWYGDIIEQEQGQGADSLQVVTPCCRQVVPFAALQFIDGGFAMFELQVSDPEIDNPMPADMQSEVESVLGCSLKQVWARY